MSDPKIDHTVLFWIAREIANGNGSIDKIFMPGTSWPRGDRYVGEGYAISFKLTNADRVELFRQILNAPYEGGIDHLARRKLGDAIAAAHHAGIKVV